MNIRGPCGVVERLWNEARTLAEDTRFNERDIQNTVLESQARALEQVVAEAGTLTPLGQEAVQVRVGLLREAKTVWSWTKAPEGQQNRPVSLSELFGIYPWARAHKEKQHARARRFGCIYTWQNLAGLKDKGKAAT